MWAMLGPVLMAWVLPVVLVLHGWSEPPGLMAAGVVALLIVVAVLFWIVDHVDNMLHRQHPQA